MEKRILIIGLVSMLVFSSVVHISIGDNVKILNNKKQSSNLGNTLYVGGSGLNNYTNIQDAIDNSSNEDTVYVYSGIYYENIIVDKSVYLIGGNKEGTIIDAQKNGTPITIVADGCIVSNFSLFNCEEQINQNWGDAVIKIYGVNDVVVKDNILNAGNVQTSPFVNYGAIDIDGCLDCKIINNFIVQSTLKVILLVLYYMIIHIIILYLETMYLILILVFPL